MANGQLRTPWSVYGARPGASWTQVDNTQSNYHHELLDGLLFSGSRYSYLITTT